MSINRHRVVSIIFTVVIVGVLLSQVGLPSLQECVDMFRGVSWRPMAILIVCVVCAMVLRGIRWWIFLGREVQSPLGDYILSFGWCFVLMSFVPARAGELSRVGWAKKRGGSGSKAAGTIVAERLQDLVLLLSVFSAVILINPAVSETFRYSACIWLIVLGSVYLAVTILGQRISQMLVPVHFSNGLVLRVKGYLIHFMSGVSILGVARVHIVTFFSTFCLWSVLSIGVYFYLTSIFNVLPFSASILVLSIVNISGLIGVSPGNAGIYEMAGIMALSFYGIDAKQALIAIASLHIIVIVTTLTYGALCYVGALYLSLYKFEKIHVCNNEQKDRL